MDPLVYTYSPLDQIASADLNTVQRSIMALRVAVGDATNDWSGVTEGMQGVAFQSSGSLANATVATYDASIDWRDRVIFGSLFLPGAANTQPGGANDTNYESNSGTWATFFFYSGTGATDAGASVVTDGNVPAAGYYVTPVTNVFVFCNPAAGGGKLRLYNNTGGALDCIGLFAFATADLGKR